MFSDERRQCSFKSTISQDGLYGDVDTSAPDDIELEMECGENSYQVVLKKTDNVKAAGAAAAGATTSTMAVHTPTSAKRSLPIAIPSSKVSTFSGGAHEISSQWLGTPPTKMRHLHYLTFFPPSLSKLKGHKQEVDEKEERHTHHRRASGRARVCGFEDETFDWFE